MVLIHFFILQNDRKNPYVYADVIKEFLVHGSGKFINLITSDLGNRGNFFMMKPMESIYHVFINTAKESYTWVSFNN